MGLSQVSRFAFPVRGVTVLQSFTLPIPQKSRLGTNYNPNSNDSSHDDSARINSLEVVREIKDKKTPRDAGLSAPGRALGACRGTRTEG